MSRGQPPTSSRRARNSTPVLYSRFLNDIKIVSDQEPKARFLIMHASNLARDQSVGTLSPAISRRARSPCRRGRHKSSNGLVPPTSTPSRRSLPKSASAPEASSFPRTTSLTSPSARRPAAGLHRSPQPARPPPRERGRCARKGHSLRKGLSLRKGRRKGRRQGRRKGRRKGRSAPAGISRARRWSAAAAAAAALPPPRDRRQR